MLNTVCNALTQQVDNIEQQKFVLCRYTEDGSKLIKAIRPIYDMEYLAISHVWGQDAKWQKVHGIDGEIYVSDEKAQLLTEQLATIVQDKWFWMDILCIDQRDDDARVAITQHIPAIFRGATRTVVIRGAAGLRACCVNAYKLLPGGEVYDYSTVRSHHQNMHKDIRFEESVLTRLWPLQEMLISDHLQFVRCNDVADDKISKPPLLVQGYMSMSSANILTDLLSLAIAWAYLSNNPTGSSLPVVEFQQAFLHCTSVRRTPMIMNKLRKVPANAELWVHFDSTRRTSKARDFILATMPQYNFYTVPNSAKQMTFGQLFVDCCNQLSRAQSPVEEALVPLLASGSLSFSKFLTATENVPEPTCLGDFVKLLGGTNPILPRKMVTFTDNPEPADVYKVEAQELVYNDQVETIRLLKQCMDASKDLWRSATTGMDGELLQALTVDGHLSQDQFASDRQQHPLISIMWSLLLQILTATDPTPENIRETLMGWNEFAAYLSRPDSLQNLVQFTALISCGLGGSAFEWSKRNLLPLTVTFRNQRLLVLVPRSVAESTLFEFLICRATKGLMLTSQESEERWTLVARNMKADPSVDVMCLFPPDIEFT